jgi:hypothetical protein
MWRIQAMKRGVDEVKKLYEHVTFFARCVLILSNKIIFEFDFFLGVGRYSKSLNNILP